MRPATTLIQSNHGDALPLVTDRDIRRAMKKKGSRHHNLSLDVIALRLNAWIRERPDAIKAGVQAGCSASALNGTISEWRHALPVEYWRRGWALRATQIPIDERNSGPVVKALVHRINELEKTLGMHTEGGAESTFVHAHLLRDMIDEARDRVERHRRQDHRGNVLLRPFVAIGSRLVGAVRVLVRGEQDVS